MDVEIDRLSKNGIDEKNGIIKEYETIVESLQKSLKECKAEQARIRVEINDLIRENLNAVDILRDAFSRANNDEHNETVENRECMENLRGQLAIIQLEKDSLFQLWLMALKTVDTLEQELKQTHKNEKPTKYYEYQVNNVKETYSEAIKALETKLLHAKEHFEKQQILWQSTREKISRIECEKTKLEEKLMNIQKDISYKDETNYQAIERLESQLNITRQQFELLNASKMKLEKELMEMRCFTTQIVARNQESKEKVAEAIELVETAVREREIVLQREQMIVNEKTKLAARLANSSNEFAIRLDRELCELRENCEKNIRKYMNEIKELKAELRDKTLKMEHVQREYYLIEEELERMQYGPGNYSERSSLKVRDSERKSEYSQHKLEVREKLLKRKFDDKIREFENRILELEQKLTNSNDRLQQNYGSNAKEVDDCVRESHDKMKESVKRYLNIEKRLIRTLDERESVASELRSLQLTHDREITRRDDERRLLESRIRELQDDIQNANDFADKSAAKADSSEKRIQILEKELEERQNQTQVDNGDVKCLDAGRSTQLKIIQEKYEEKMLELNRYVKMHQKLSTRWKEEAQSMALKFHGRYKELRSKVNILKTQNDMLNNELIFWRQQVASCRTQTIQRYDQGDSAR